MAQSGGHLWRARPEVGQGWRRALTPARLLVLSFGGLIAAGTVGLEVLPGLYTGEGLSWVDALFTATSAVCVTGLIVVDTATHFSAAGQAFLLLLIQLGGLGILTFTTLAILALGRRLSLNQEAAHATDAGTDVDVRELVRNIVVFTFFFEAVGAAALFAAWVSRLGPGPAAWHALFHAVSAFCNAGFSTFSDSLVGFRASPVTLFTVMALIVVGGVGFLTLEECRTRLTGGGSKRPHRLSMHTRLVLWVTGALVLGGGILFTALEWSHTLAALPAWVRGMNGLFMSVTARTAGFNTVDYGSTTESTSLIGILLMAIGGSPGSTAGGLKTTTVAVLALAGLARLRGERETTAFRRTIPRETVRKAMGLFVVVVLVMTAGVLMYTVAQSGLSGEQPPGDFLRLGFEAVSAFNTVGLSMGATGGLTPMAKVVTVALMYVGRVGPLTVIGAIALRGPRNGNGFRHALEDVSVG